MCVCVCVCVFPFFFFKGAGRSLQPGHPAKVGWSPRGDLYPCRNYPRFDLGAPRYQGSLFSLLISLRHRGRCMEPCTQRWQKSLNRGWFCVLNTTPPLLQNIMPDLCHSNQDIVTYYWIAIFFCNLPPQNWKFSENIKYHQSAGGQILLSYRSAAIWGIMFHHQPVMPPLEWN